MSAQTLINTLADTARAAGRTLSTATGAERKAALQTIAAAVEARSVEILAANAMDMELVYYFKPKNGSIKNAVEKQARKKAQEILNQSNQTMKLEDQQTNSSSQELELERLTKDIMSKMPQNLWD